MTHPVEAALRRFLDGRAPADLAIVYDDVHGLWGGTRVTVDAAGACERAEWERGSVAPDVVSGVVEPARLADLVRLLVEVRAWEQRVDDSPPVPDESRATLTIRCAGAESVIWERVNDLRENARLSLVRDALLGRST